jgi:hypothetical protein
MKFNPKFKSIHQNFDLSRNAISPKPVFLSPMSLPSTREKTPVLYERRNLVETAKLRCRFKRKSIIKKTGTQNTSKIISKVECKFVIESFFPLTLAFFSSHTYFSLNK